MNIRAWAHALPSSFYTWGTFNAIPRDPFPYIKVLDSVQGMTTPSNMHLLNVAVQHLGPNECYLEVGTWRGATLIGALIGNEAYGVAVDDDSMDEHDGDELPSGRVWAKNIIIHGVSTRTRYIDASVPAVWGALDVPPIGVYLFDGDKSTDETAYAGLAGVVPFLADEALVVVDDANEITIRMAVAQLEREHAGHLYKILDIPTPGNCWPVWWNGVMCLAYRR